MADQVRWFDALGTCACGRPATGNLRGLHESYGSYGVSCQKCAERRIRLANKDREREKKEFHSIP